MSPIQSLQFKVSSSGERIEHITRCASVKKSGGKARDWYHRRIIDRLERRGKGWIGDSTGSLAKPTELSCPSQVPTAGNVFAIWEGTQMKQFFDQLLAFLQQGIAAIFRFVQLIWTWSIDQINKVFQAPWDSWPLWKQALLVLVIAAVIFAVYKAAVELWVAGIRVLRAFASLLVAFIMTLPAILVAGAIALGGLWAVNNLSFSEWPTFTSLFPNSDSKKEPSPRASNGQSGKTTDETVGRGSGGQNERAKQ